MSHFIRSLATSAALAALASFAPLASATVLNFDDLADGAVPASYGGLDWSASTWLAFSGPADPFTAHSGNGMLAADWGTEDTGTAIKFTAPSVVTGAWFSGYDDSSVSFKLYSGGQLVASSSTLTTSATPSFLATGYAGLVDTVIVSSGQQAFYAMDDFTFQTPVPEPATYALMFAGLGLVAFAARRRA